MKEELCLHHDQEKEKEKEKEKEPSLQHCWWRSAAKFEECGKLRLGMLGHSRLTARHKLLREMERLALIAPENLDELRHKLLTYRSGDLWIPTGGIKKEEMDIPPVNTILLVGFHNSGKSSLVNLMYSTLGRSGLIPFAQTSSGLASNYTTMFMEEHNVLRSARNGLCVYDTRGFDYDHVCETLEELTEWMTDGVQHNRLCWRLWDKLPSRYDVDCSKFATRRVNCVMVVADAAEIYRTFKAGDRKPMEALRQIFCLPALRKSNESPILILTHGDELSTEDRINSRLKICEYLGVSETTGVYDIVCLTEHGFVADDSDPVTAYALTEAVYRALVISDRGHLPKRNLQDWGVLFLSWLLRCIGAFFAFLANIFSKLGNMDTLKL